MTWAISRQSVLLILRERTVAILALLFVALVLISAYLGWSATSTVNAIYLKSSQFLAAAGKPVPPNPVLDISPLALLRNMSIYVMLIGALASIAVGYQLVAIDRKSGLMPLIGSRPLPAKAYAQGKILALCTIIAALIGIAALVSIASFVAIPEFTLDSNHWARLLGFFGLSALYMVLFGLIGMASAAMAKSETVGLLIPVTLWLTVTFILPTLTANIHPTASLNPVVALATAPDTAFFHWTGWAIGTFSLAQAFTYLSAGLLDFRPSEAEVRAAIPPLGALLSATAIAGFVAHRGMTQIDKSKGEFDA